MAEYIGARISLISKSDIRYVGTLHEINSETSTVALENVRSMGTEDRRTGADAREKSERLYEYIVFRGSDVKDLRIEEAPKPAAPQPTTVPDDPAILGSTRPPHQQQPGTPSQGQQPPFGQGPPPYAQGFPPYPPQLHNQGFGRGGFPPGPGAPGGPAFGYGGPGGYGGPPPPPGWYPPGQGPQGFPHGPPGPFPPQQHQQQQNKQKQQQPPPPIGQQGGQQLPRDQQPPPIGPAKDNQPGEQKKPEAAKAEAKKAPAPAQLPAPTPPVETKPDVAAATAPPAPAQKAVPSGPKSRAPIPLNPAAKPTPPTSSAVPIQNAQAAASAAQSYASATQTATAAVAAAMAKLPMAQRQQNQQGGDYVDNLTRKVQDMRTDDQARHARQPGTGGFASGQRGRGRGRGGHGGQTRAIEVPTTDFDFQGSNAKFNKDELVKEAIATGSPLGTPNETNGSAINGEAHENGKPADEVVIPKSESGYNKQSSFFDNISSELKDRDDKRIQEFRSEERKKNFETFGQGSVDSYRRGFGRGRGRGFRGGGGGGGGRGFGQPHGNHRGGRGSYPPRAEAGEN